MSDVFRLQGSIDVDINRVMSSLNTVGTEVDNTGSRMQNMSKKMQTFGDGLSKFGSSMFKFVSLPLLGVGTAGLKMSSDLNETNNKMEATFGEMSKTVDEWSKNSTNQYGLTSQVFKDNVTLYGSLSQDILKMDSKTSAEHGRMLTQRATDISSYYNISMEESNSLMMQLYSGETEGWKRLGITINDTTMQEYALSKGISKTVAEMSLEEKTALRIEMALDKTNRASGDFENTSDGLANSVKILTANIKEFVTNLMDRLRPTVEIIVNKLNDFMNVLNGLSDEQLDFILKIGMFLIALAPVLIVVGKVISMAGKITSMVSTFSASCVALGTTMGAVLAPILAVIGVIVGLGVAIVALWNTNEEFRNACTLCWNSIKEFAFLIFGALQAFWQEWGGTITSIFSSIWDIVGTIFTTAINIISGVIQFFTALFTGDFEGMGDAIVNIVTSLWNGVTGIFKGAFDILCKIGSAFADIFLGIWNGIVSGVKGFVNGIIDGINYCIRGINSIRVDAPDWVTKITGMESFGLNVPTIPNWNYKGGIFNKPTVLGNNQGVGDDYMGQGSNPEIVSPVSDLKDMIKDVLQVTIPLNFNGREFTRVVVAPYQEELDKYNQRNPRLAY